MLSKIQKVLTFIIKVCKYMCILFGHIRTCKLYYAAITSSSQFKGMKKIARICMAIRYTYAYHYEHIVVGFIDSEKKGGNNYDNESDQETGTPGNCARE